MDRRRYHLSLLGCLSLVWMACACTNSNKSPQYTSTLPTNDGNQVLATIGKTQITLGQVDESLASQLTELNDHLYQLRRQKLDSMIDDILLTEAAQEKGMSKEAYQQAEINSFVKTPTNEEIERFFQERKNQLPPGAALDDFRDRIAGFLRNQAQTERSKEVFAKLRAAKAIDVAFAPPAKPRVHVEATGPSRGPDNAKVTIVTFSDFECPFCKRGHETIDQVVAKYKDKVKLVFRHFPLSFHAKAQKAAEASLCAHEQNQFWAFHDALFADQSRLEPEQMIETAVKLGLDKDKFSTCLQSGNKAEQVKTDMTAGEKAGVTGTPAFVINGVVLSGALPIEQFSTIIEEELSSTN